MNERISAANLRGYIEEGIKQEEEKLTLITGKLSIYRDVLDYVKLLEKEVKDNA